MIYIDTQYLTENSAKPTFLVVKLRNFIVFENDMPNKYNTINTFQKSWDSEMSIKCLAK